MFRIAILCLGASWFLAVAQAADQPFMLVAGDSRPGHYLEDGKPKGFVIDILKEAFHRSGRPVDFALLPWARCLAETEKGAADGVFAATRTADREKAYLFSQEVLLLESESAFVRADDTTSYLPTASGLADTRLAYIGGTSFGLSFDRALANKELRRAVPTHSVDGLILMLTRHRVEMIAGDRLMILYAAKALGVLGELREVTPPLREGPVYLAFTRARDMSEVSRDFDAALKSMKEDGTYGALFARYFN